MPEQPAGGVDLAQHVAVVVEAVAQLLRVRLQPRVQLDDAGAVVAAGFGAPESGGAADGYLGLFVSREDMLPPVRYFTSVRALRAMAHGPAPMSKLQVTRRRECRSVGADALKAPTRDPGPHGFKVVSRPRMSLPRSGFTTRVSLLMGATLRRQLIRCRPAFFERR